MPALWDQPHHDGSALYVADPTPTLGGRTSVLLRVPRTNDVSRAASLLEDQAASTSRSGCWLRIRACR